MDFSALALALFFSFIPVFFWTVILWRKHRQAMLLFFLLNAFLAMVFGLLFSKMIEIPVEQWVQGRYIGGIGIFLSYMAAGIVIEYGKNFIVRLTGGKYFKSLDDVMDMSFATALGFTFYINAFQFYDVFQGLMPGIEGPVKMLKYVVQSIFYILPAHILCSGIFGYFYGFALFAGDEIQAEHQEKHWRYKLIRFKTMKVFEGTLISTIFYGVFFTILKFDPTIGDLTEALHLGRLVVLGTPIDEKIMPFFSFVFFSLGTVFLFRLLDQNNNAVRQKRDEDLAKARKPIPSLPAKTS